MNNTYARRALTRRSLLTGFAALGAATVLGRGSAVLAQAENKVRIGVLLPLTGDADEFARQMRMGVETAIAEINDAGGIMGRAMEAAYRDSETAPGVLPDHCRKLVGDWGGRRRRGPVGSGRAPLRVPGTGRARRTAYQCHQPRRRFLQPGPVFVRADDGP